MATALSTAVGEGGEKQFELMLGRGRVMWKTWIWEKQFELMLGRGLTSQWLANPCQPHPTYYLICSPLRPTTLHPPFSNHPISQIHFFHTTLSLPSISSNCFSPPSPTAVEKAVTTTSTYLYWPITMSRISQSCGTYMLFFPPIWCQTMVTGMYGVLFRP